MAILTLPNEQHGTRDLDAIRAFLGARGIVLARVPVPVMLRAGASSEEILALYREFLGPYMRQHGYQAADVVVLHPDMPEREQLRAKFIREHTHSEDEVRCFVSGSGRFWFHLTNEAREEDEVFSVLCGSGDLLTVPAGIKHWFDCGERPDVTAIRIFTDRSGWVPVYTGSGIEQKCTLAEPCCP